MRPFTPGTQKHSISDTTPQRHCAPTNPQTSPNAEADHLVALGRDHLIKSDVVDSDTGDIVSSKERTSSGYFLPRRGLDAVVARLEARIARWAQVPVGHGEPFHLLRYNPAEEYVSS